MGEGRVIECAWLHVCGGDALFECACDRVSGFGFQVLGVGIRGLDFGFWCLGFGVSGFGCRGAAPRFTRGYARQKRYALET